MSYDEWMNVCGALGMTMYLSAWGWVMNGVGKELLPLNRAMRALGLTMILIPLFMRWYLTAGLLVCVSLIMACFFGLQRRRSRSNP